MPYVPARDPRPGLQPRPHLGRPAVRAARRRGPGWSARCARTAPSPARGRRRAPRRPAGSRARRPGPVRRQVFGELAGDGRVGQHREREWVAAADVARGARRRSSGTPACASSCSLSALSSTSIGRHSTTDAPAGVGAPGAVWRVRPAGDDDHPSPGATRPARSRTQPSTDARRSYPSISKTQPRPSLGVRLPATRAAAAPRECRRRPHRRPRPPGARRPPRPDPELVEQRGLAEPAGAVHEQHAVRRLPGQGGVEGLELRRASDEGLRACGVDDRGEVVGHASNVGAARGCEQRPGVASRC